MSGNAIRGLSQQEQRNRMLALFDQATPGLQQYMLNSLNTLVSAEIGKLKPKQPIRAARGRPQLSLVVG